MTRLCHFGSNGPNILGRKLAALSSEPTHFIAALGRLHHVFGMSARAQMFGIDASRIIASMKNVCALGDKPLMHNPRKAVRQNPVAAPEAKAPVAIGILGPNPFYASTRRFLGKPFQATCDAAVFASTLRRRKWAAALAAWAVTIRAAVWFPSRHVLTLSEA